MKQSKTGRVLAAIFLGALFGLYRHYQQMRVLSLGRDGFLSEQAHYFDRIAKLHSTAFTLVAGIILGAIAFGLYELIALTITKLIPTVEVEE